VLTTVILQKNKLVTVTACPLDRWHNSCVKRTSWHNTPPEAGILVVNMLVAENELIFIAIVFTLPEVHSCGQKRQEKSKAADPINE
jgi:hypothetical protein